MRILFTIFYFAISAVAFGQTFNWTAQTSGVTTALNDVFFVDNKTGWAVGAGGVILHTTDGGTTWSAQTSGTTDEMRSVFFLDSVTGWAIGKDVFNILLKTTDGGATWSDITQSSLATGTLRDIVFTNANDGWMIASDSIYKSSDGGVTWISQTVGNTVSNKTYRALAVTLNGVNTIGTPYVGGRSKRTGFPVHADVFAKSLSGSAGFDFIPSDQSNFKTTDLGIYSIAFATPTVGFAGGAAGTIYKLDNFQGITNVGPWDVNLELDSSQVIRGLTFPTASNGMFITKDTTTAVNALIYHTADTANTWTMTPDVIPGLLHNALYAPDANTAWVVGLNGAIYKGVSLSTGIEEGELAVQTNVFPNPTIGLVTVELNGEVNGLIDYTMLDITGRQIVKGAWKKDGVIQRFELDMTNLVTGVYMLSFTTSNGQNQIIRIAKN